MLINTGCHHKSLLQITPPLPSFDHYYHCINPPVSEVSPVSELPPPQRSTLTAHPSDGISNVLYPTNVGMHKKVLQLKKEAKMNQPMEMGDCTKNCYYLYQNEMRGRKQLVGFFLWLPEWLKGKQFSLIQLFHTLGSRGIEDVGEGLVQENRKERLIIT